MGSSTAIFLIAIYMLSVPLILSNTKRPFYLANPHLETIVPSLFYKPRKPDYEREQFGLADGDFLDLDWLKSGNKRLVIISHGLEGDSHRQYVVRAANYFHERDWDILAWNNRGCGGEINRLPTMAHHGTTNDLSEVVDHSLGSDYYEIVLLGFSMGGCQTLKYLSTHDIDDRVKGGIGFSVTFDFHGMMVELEKPSNRLYKGIFLSKTKTKISLINEQNPGFYMDSNIGEVNSFAQFHEQFSLKMYGFKTLEEFYYDASPGNFMSDISKPMLIVNAKNDPFLGAKNYPDTEGIKNLKVIYTKHGGHVGFSKPFSTASYMEDLAHEFIKGLDE